jgi:hypothetical protein
LLALAAGVAAVIYARHRRARRTAARAATLVKARSARSLLAAGGGTAVVGDNPLRAGAGDAAPPGVAVRTTSQPGFKRAALSTRRAMLPRGTQAELLGNKRAFAARRPRESPDAALPVAEAARLWSRVASTTPQTFAFNAPLQLERGFNGHRPDQAQVLSLAPAPGDLVVAATDGLHDNLFPDAQAALLAKFDWAPCAALVHAATRRRAEDAAAATRAAGGEPPLQRLRLLNTAEAPVSDAELAERERLCRATLRGMAAMLAAHAHRVGHDPHAGDTPFAREAAKARKRFSGGKPDDVTVVVAMLLPDVGGAD